MCLQATLEEITNQYRKLSRIYHPDKCRDPEKQVYARQLFEKAKTAHESKITQKFHYSSFTNQYVKVFTYSALFL